MRDTDEVILVKNKEQNFSVRKIILMEENTMAKLTVEEFIAAIKELSVWN